VQRAKSVAEADDITSQVLREAAGVEQWTEVQPTMFEDTFDKEMDKYDKFKSVIEGGEATQRELLTRLKERHDALITSRRNDPTIKQREHAIQSLELAYHKCKEIEANLAEGTKFHQEFSALLKRFRDECQQWANQRSSELETITCSMGSVSLGESHEEAEDDGVPLTPVSPRSEPPAPRVPGMNLPPPGSEDWEEVPLPPPPSGIKRPKSVTRGGR